MASAELALAMPVLVSVLAIALTALQLGMDQVRCVDAARSAVRVMARGDSTTRVVSEAQAVAPLRANVSTTAAGGRVSVTVSAPPPRLLGALGLGMASSATATALLEGWV
jgi:hypothetical protein